MTTYAKNCIVCDKQLANVTDDDENQPDKGLYFRTHGQYGSEEFDPMDGSILEICVCDECIVRARSEGKVLYGREWKPVVSIDPGFDKIPTLVGKTPTPGRPLTDWTGEETTSFDFKNAGEDVLFVDWDDIGAVDNDGNDLYPEIEWIPAIKDKCERTHKRAMAHRAKFNKE